MNLAFIGTMDLSSQQLVAIASDKRVMQTLKTISQYIMNIEAIERELECNNKRIAEGKPVSFKETTQELLDAKKTQLAEVDWSKICTCTHTE